MKRYHNLFGSFVFAIALGITVALPPRSASAAGGPATQTAATTPESTAEVSRLKRGQEIHRVLRDILGRPDGAAGLRLKDGTANLVFLSPPSVSGDFADDFASATVVLHEPFKDRTDGVWVGYADGHLEFARTIAELSACKNQPQILNDAISAGRMLATKPERRAGVVTGRLKLRILDSDGKPVPDAKIGCFGELGDRFPQQPHAYFWAGEQPTAGRSNSDGEIILRGENVFNARFADHRFAPLYVLSNSESLAALVEVERAEFGIDKVREIRLQPACNITATLTSIGLLASGLRPHSAVAIACKVRMFPLISLESACIGPRFEFPLPPGDYEIIAGCSFTEKVRRFVRIDGHQRELKLQIDLPPLNTTEGFGRPAPELKNIRAWKNAGPLRLGGLHGRVVLLNFWGYWCPYCIDEMPALIHLHDDFKDQGLTIIAIHDDSAASLKEVDDKLVGIRKQYWGGRELPFITALDGIDSTRGIKGATTSHGGTTAAAYGIRSFPTTIVIGRDGTLLREIDMTDSNAPAEIVKLLASKP